MNGQYYRAGSAAILLASAAIAIAAVTAASPQPAMADNCPAGGTVRLGVEPYDTAARLVPIYEKMGKLISDKIGAPRTAIGMTTQYHEGGFMALWPPPPPP